MNSLAITYNSYNWGKTVTNFENVDAWPCFLLPLWQSGELDSFYPGDKLENQTDFLQL